MAQRRRTGSGEPEDDDGDVGLHEARAGLDPDTVFDTVAGAVLFATAVSDIADLDAVASSLADLLLRGIEPRR